MLQYKDVKAKDLDGAFIELNNVSYSGNVYHEGASGSLVFGVKEGNIYRINPMEKEQQDDITKGQLVVEVSDEVIRWRQEHEIGDVYAKRYLGESKFQGDAGMPMIDALSAYLAGTFNIYSWDANIKTKDGVVAKLIRDGKRNDQPEVKVKSDGKATTVTVSD